MSISHAEWVKRRSAQQNPAQQNSCGILSGQKPSKYVLVTCRELTPAENQILSKNFKQISVFSPVLNSGNLDPSKMPCDLLIVDATKGQNHVFLEILKPMCDAQGVPIIVLKKKLSNYKQLASDLEAFVISRFEDLVGDAFFAFLTKTRLTKLRPRWLTLLKGCFSLLA